MKSWFKMLPSCRSFKLSDEKGEHIEIGDKPLKIYGEPFLRRNNSSRRHGTETVFSETNKPGSPWIHFVIICFIFKNNEE